MSDSSSSSSSERNDRRHSRSKYSRHSSTRNGSKRNRWRRSGRKKGDCSPSKSDNSSGRRNSSSSPSTASSSSSSSNEKAVKARRERRRQRQRGKRKESRSSSSDNDRDRSSSKSVSKSVSKSSSNSRSRSNRSNSKSGQSSSSHSSRRSENRNRTRKMKNGNESKERNERHKTERRRNKRSPSTDNKHSSKRRGRNDENYDTSNRHSYSRNDRSETKSQSRQASERRQFNSRDGDRREQERSQDRRDKSTNKSAQSRHESKSRSNQESSLKKEEKSNEDSPIFGSKTSKDKTNNCDNMSLLSPSSRRSNSTRRLLRRRRNNNNDYAMNDYPEYLRNEINESEMKRNEYNDSYCDSENKSNPSSGSGNNNSSKSVSGSRVLEAAEHSLQKISNLLPKRPRNAKLDGKGVFPIKVLANSSVVELALEEITKYDVEFNPHIPEDARPRRDNIFRQLGKQLREIYGEFFTDNTRIFAINCIEEDQTFLFDDGKGKLTLKNGTRLKVHELDTQYKMQMVGIIAQKLYQKAKLKRLGTRLYDFTQCTRIRFNDEQQDDPNHLSLCPGYIPSTSITTDGIQLGFDTCHRLLEDRTVRDVMDEIWQNIRYEIEEKKCVFDQNEEFEHRCMNELQHRTGLSDFDCKLYRIDGIDFTSNKYSAINPQCGDSISICEYYGMHYDIELESEEYGMIVHHKKQRKNEACQTTLKIPPELLRLTGYDAKEHGKKRNVTTDISNATKVPAIKRYSAWKSLINKLHDITCNDKEMSNIVRIESSRNNGDGDGTIAAQILPCPNIVLRKEKHIAATRGGNNNNNNNNNNNESSDIRSVRSNHSGKSQNGNGEEIYQAIGPEKLQFEWQHCSFVEKGDSLSKHIWGIVFASCNAGCIQAFILHLFDAARDGGFEKGVQAPIEFCIDTTHIDEKFWDQEFKRQLQEILARDKNLKALIIVLPRTKDKIMNSIYSNVKEVCSVEFPVLSQCVKSTHLSNKHVIQGVLKQILVKLGSIPWKIQFDLQFGRLDIVNTPTMVVGINVNHDTRRKVSVVGFAASYDRDYVRYWTNVKFQKQGKELIHDLNEPMSKAIDNFQKINGGTYPTQIIVYRDGVSSTMVEQVYETELRAIKLGIDSECPDDIKNEIKLEFITVQKRVNNRFVLNTNKTSAPPGTAVNTCVVSNQMWDFFIVPAKPPEGCLAIPTRFCVLCDDLRLNDDKGEGEHDLMTFTNGLCSLYFNWPGPTRVPAPIKYACKIAQQYCQAVEQKMPHYRLNLTYHFL